MSTSIANNITTVSIFIRARFGYEAISESYHYCDSRTRLVRFDMRRVHQTSAYWSLIIACWPSEPRNFYSSCVPSIWNIFRVNVECMHTSSSSAFQPLFHRYHRITNRYIICTYSDAISSHRAAGTSSLWILQFLILLTCRRLLLAPSQTHWCTVCDSPVRSQPNAGPKLEKWKINKLWLLITSLMRKGASPFTDHNDV